MRQKLLQLADDPLVGPQLFDAFPKPMRKSHAEAIRAHRLRNEILGTKVANRLVNRLGPGVAFDLTEEEGASLQPGRRAFLVAERLLDLDELWTQIEQDALPETVRIELFAIAAASVRTHLSDILRAAGGETHVASAVQTARARRAQDRARGDQAHPGRGQERSRGPARPAARARRQRRHRPAAWSACTSSTACSGSPRWPRARSSTSSKLTRAYTRLGEALGLDWAQQQVARFVPADQWERLLTAGLARDFEQLRIDFLARGRSKRSGEPRSRNGSSEQSARIDQFRQADRARAQRRQCQRADARADRQPGADPARSMISAAVLVPAPDYQRSRGLGL